MVAFHGYKGENKNTLVGGTDRKRAKMIVRALERRGFSAELASSKSGLAGLNAENINNQGETGLSIQLEISREQREAFFDDFYYKIENTQRTVNFMLMSVRSKVSWKKSIRNKQIRRQNKRRSVD